MAARPEATPPDYVEAGSGVIVNLAHQGAAQNTGGGGVDTLSNIENLSGSNFNDTLTGDADANILNGWAGNDSLVGAAGNDTLTADVGQRHVERRPGQRRSWTAGLPGATPPAMPMPPAP